MTDRYTWADVMAFARMARRERDLEMLPAILAKLLDAIDEVDKDKEAAMESAFREDRHPSHLAGVAEPGEEDLGASVHLQVKGQCRCTGLSHRDDCPDWVLPW